ncbi:MAG: dienelactone hydrolase family protein [Anaerolineales bacterium]
MNGQMIEFPSNGHQTPGYLSLPENPGRFPAVIAIQEWWGLVGHIKDVADRLAAEGFVTLAPDLYHGQTASEPDEARKLAMALDRRRAVDEILAAARYLRSLEIVQTGKVGIIGWCMGGALALTTAASGHLASGLVDAVVCFYGRPLDARDTANIKAPVLGLYGELDTGIPGSIVMEFQQQLAAAKVEHDIHVYPGADHAFFNDDRPEAYHAEAAADAWVRALDWFRRHLK